MSTIRLTLYLGLILVVASCGDDNTTAEVQSGIFDFKSASHTQIDFANTLVETDELNIIEYLYYYNGAGVAVGDVNGDGLEDIYFAANQGSDRLYMNKGNLVFEDVTIPAGIDTTASWSTGVAMTDLTGDGHLDIYVCKVSLFTEATHNELYVNNGDGTFAEQAAKYGLDFAGYSTHAGLLDYDQDGDIDIYLLNHTVHSVRSYGTTDKRTEKDSLSGDLLLENRVNEGQQFVDVTAAAGIYSSPLGYGLAVACADLDGDGLTDIYVGNDFHEDDYVYINNGDKTFSERKESRLLHSSQFSMGVDIADIDGDGTTDVFTTDMLPYSADIFLRSGGEDTDQVKRIKEELGFGQQYARNHLQLGRGDGTFTDVGYMTETFATDWSWSVLLQDFDNDADKDIFITNGIVRRPNDLDYINYLNEYDQYQKTSAEDRTAKLLEQMPSQPLSNILFAQERPLSFSKVHSSAVGPPSFSTGAAYADLDNDGDLDIVTNNINAPAFVMENTTGGNTLQLQLTDGNRSILGSTVRVYSPDRQWMEQSHISKGFMSTSTSRVHIGLGQRSTVDSVVVIWPDGATQTVTSPETGVLLKIERLPTASRGAAGQSSTAEAYDFLPYTHRENRYYDETSEKLLPERLSTEGPCSLVEDLNGDGIQDIYVGGGRDQGAALFYGRSDGSYQRVEMPSFESDARYEDVAVATIDFDADGDKDLYVVSGGGDHKELNKLLEDRIYLNNDGVYKRIPLSLPHTNGSCIAVADYDGDGYEDMFVGGRSIPGSYGLVPYSFVLYNKKGQGVDIGLKERLGMVTDAVWSDIDGDKDMDLVVCGDWMPIRTLANTDGEFVEHTKAYGLDSTHGLWNSICLVDLNGDGMQDILAGNIGTNVSWKASVETPVKLYVGDYDSNGASEPIIFYDYMGRYMPFASLDVLSSQLPSVKKRYRTYAQYSAAAALADLVEDESRTVETRYAYELRSMAYISGRDGYTPVPMPAMVQQSEVRAIVSADGRSAYLASGGDTFVAHIGQGGSPSVLQLVWTASGDLSVEQVYHLPVTTSPRSVSMLEQSSRLLVTQGQGEPLLIGLD